MILIKYDEAKKKSNFKPCFYFYLEEYILNNLLKKDKIFFFQWQMEGIVIGKNQIIENEINLSFVRGNNIDVFRRTTGGGCVFNNKETIIFSIIAPNTNEKFNFKKHLSKIIEAFYELGINLYLSPRNDILLDGKKVSGNAFLQNKNGTILHGTLLYNLDINTTVRCLTPNQEKLISKGIESISSRITNLKQHLKGMKQEQLMTYLNNYLTNDQYILNSQEISQIEKNSEKYSSKKWIFGEHPQYNKKLKKCFDWGCLEILLSLNKGKIEQIFLQGDFFNKNNNLSDFVNKFVNITYTKKCLKEILQKNNIKDYIWNAKNEDFLSLLEKGILDL